MQSGISLARIRSLGAAAVVCTAAALLEAPALAATIDVTDIAGRAVTVKKGVERVILGEGRMIYSLAVLDREDPFHRVVGWRDDLIKYDPDAWRKYEERFPGARDIANFGSPYSGEFSVEKAISLETDLVLMNLGNLFKAREAGILETLDKVGIPVLFVDFRQRPTQNTVPSILLMGRVMDREDRAQAFVDYYLQQMRVVYNRVANKPETEKPVVFIERAAGWNPNSCCSTFGSANLGKLVEEAGGINWGSRYFSGFSGAVNPEKIFVDDPDVMILTGANWSEANPQTAAVLLGYEAEPGPVQQRMRALADRRGFDRLAAVKGKRFFSVYHQFYNSPYHFVALQAFAKWFYPEDFEDVDPVANFRALHDSFLPIDYSGMFWAALN